MNLLEADVALVPIGVVTVTSTMPAACDGGAAVSDSGVRTVELAVTPPNRTVAPSWNSRPVTVTVGAQLVDSSEA